MMRRHACATGMPVAAGIPGEASPAARKNLFFMRGSSAGATAVGREDGTSAASKKIFPYGMEASHPAASCPLSSCQTACHDYIVDTGRFTRRLEASFNPHSRESNHVIQSSHHSLFPALRLRCFLRTSKRRFTHSARRCISNAHKGINRKM